MKLTDKLPVNDSTVELIANEYERSRYAIKLNSCLPSITIPHWFQREFARLATGHYTQTDALTNLCRTNVSALMYLPHISREDNTLVAYTPTREAGNEDKQLRTTFAKFCAKVNILWTDAHIQSMEQSHRAEISGVYHVATTPEEIRMVYTSMEGDSGCMHYEADKWGYPEDLHPSIVYAAPGMGVAYTKTDDGRIKSRAVVYAEGSDKRYVRLYGDPVLGKLLERDGYRCRGLEGLRLRKVAHPSLDDTYICPYIDGKGGEQTRTWEKTVFLDGDYLRVPADTKQYNQIAQIGNRHVAHPSHTSAYAYLRPLPNMTYICTLTGIEYNRLTSPSALMLGINGQAHIVNKAEAESRGMTTAFMRASDSQGVYHNGVDTFEFRGKRYFETYDNRHSLGYRRITFSDSRNIYSEPVGTWSMHTKELVDRNLRVQTVTSNMVGVTVLDVGLDRSSYNMIESEFPYYREARKAQGHKFVRCSPVLESVDAYINPQRETARKSEANRWFDMDIHSGAFVQTWPDMKWHSKRSMDHTTRFGVTFFHKSDAEIDDLLGMAFERSVYYNKIKGLRETAAESCMVGLSESVIMGLRSKVVFHICSALYERGLGYVVIGDTATYGWESVTYDQLELSLATIEAKVEPTYYDEIFRKNYLAIRPFVAPIMADIEGTLRRAQEQVAGQLTVTEGETV